MSSSSAQQLANFRIISTISQHRFACRLIVFLLSRHNSSSLYVAKQALALFLIPYPCNGGAPCFLTIVQETSRKSIRLLFAYQVHTRPRLSVTLQQSLLLLLIDFISYLIIKGCSKSHQIISGASLRWLVFPVLMYLTAIHSVPQNFAA